MIHHLHTVQGAQIPTRGCKNQCQSMLILPWVKAGDGETLLRAARNSLREVRAKIGSSAAGSRRGPLGLQKAARNERYGSYAFFVFDFTDFTQLGPSLMRPI